jgi:N-acylglucosamine-6-phosphate 2-epimerase
MIMNEVFQKLQKGLIVSCQSEGASPFNSPEGVTMFARAAASAGAAGIRSEGIDKTRMIIGEIQLPVIGLVKSSFEDGCVRITGTFKDVEDLLSIGTTIVAIDGTFRLREGLTGPDFIERIKQQYDCIVMADIATEREAIACTAAGADCISTTLSGYTPETRHAAMAPDFSLLAALARNLQLPIIAEGRITTPAMAAKAMTLGAWSVVVGSAITRPADITKWFIDAIKE